MIEEISNKVNKLSVTQQVREALTKFYLEMLSQKESEEVTISVDKFLGSKNKLVSTKTFLNDIFEVTGIKNIKVNRELMSLVIRVIEQRM